MSQAATGLCASSLTACACLLLTEDTKAEAGATGETHGGGRTSGAADGDTSIQETADSLRSSPWWYAACQKQLDGKCPYAILTLDCQIVSSM